jgi:hypothetical protein
MDPDLRDLLAAWHGGEIEPDRREQLLARLRGDEAFRQAFVAEVWMLGMLKAVQSPEPRWLRLEDEIGWSAARPASGDALEDRIVGRLGEPARRPAPRRWLRWAAAALVPLAAVLAARYWPRGGGGAVQTVQAVSTLG